MPLPRYPRIYEDREIGSVYECVCVCLVSQPTDFEYTLTGSTAGQVFGGFFWPGWVVFLEDLGGGAWSCLELLDFSCGFLGLRWGVWWLRMALGVGGTVVHSCGGVVPVACSCGLVGGVADALRWKDVVITSSETTESPWDSNALIWFGYRECNKSAFTRPAWLGEVLRDDTFYARRELAWRPK